MSIKIESIITPESLGQFQDAARFRFVRKMGRGAAFASAVIALLFFNYLWDYPKYLFIPAIFLGIGLYLFFEVKPIILRVRAIFMPLATLSLVVAVYFITRSKKSPEHGPIEFLLFIFGVLFITTLISSFRDFKSYGWLKGYNLVKPSREWLLKLDEIVSLVKVSRKDTEQLVLVFYTGGIMWYGLMSEEFCVFMDKKGNDCILVRKKDIVVSDLGLSSILKRSKATLSFGDRVLHCSFREEYYDHLRKALK